MRYFLLSTMLLISMMVHAVPAKKVWRTFQQVDGTQIELMQVGDENLHYYITRDNIPVMQDNNRFCYARPTGFSIKSTGVLAHEMQLRTPEEKINMSTIQDIEEARPFMKKKGVKKNVANSLQAITGKKKGLVILANFSDAKFYDYSEENGGWATWDRYDAILNEEGYTNSEYGAIGSVHDYYLDQSYRKLDLSFDVVGPINLENPYSYYGSNRPSDDYKAPWMIKECCEAVDSLVDFSEYDWDGDGVVEEVFVLYAGYGEASGGPSNTIWPHMWHYTSAAAYDSSLPPVLMFDNTFIEVYACSNELYGNHGKVEMGMGVFCHEFTHCLGLPDFYDTSYIGNYGMGGWDILDDGSYNGPRGIGWVPAGYTSYERQFAGWLNHTELKVNRRIINQKPINDHGVSYIIYNDNHKDEYYLLENRNQTKWDSYIPGSGLLIIHVDYDEDIWYSNNVNTIGTANDHQRMTVFHASNSLFGGHEAYPYNGNDSLTDTSVPNAKLYNENTDGSKLMHKSITNITRNEENGYISFLFTINSVTDGIMGVENDEQDAPFDVYSIDGKMVAGNMTKENLNNLPHGMYVVRKDDGSSYKVQVK